MASSLLNDLSGGRKWRSLAKRTNVPWTEAEVRLLAQLWYDRLPDAAVEAVKTGLFVGPDIVHLEDGTPSKEDLKKNEPWVVPVIENWRGKTPAVTMLADGLMGLDEMFEGRLLKEDASTDKASRALFEADKIRRACSKARRLWSNEPQGSHDPLIKYLKTLFVKRPPSKPEVAASISGVGSMQAAAGASCTACEAVDVGKSGEAEAANMHESASGAEAADLGESAHGEVASMDESEEEAASMTEKDASSTSEVGDEAGVNVALVPSASEAADGSEGESESGPGDEVDAHMDEQDAAEVARRADKRCDFHPSGVHEEVIDLLSSDDSDLEAIFRDHPANKATPDPGQKDQAVSGCAASSCGLLASSGALTGNLYDFTCTLTGIKRDVDEEDPELPETPGPIREPSFIKDVGARLLGDAAPGLIPITRGGQKSDRAGQKAKAKTKLKAKAKTKASFHRKLSKMTFSPMKRNQAALLEAHSGGHTAADHLSHTDFDLPEETWPQGPRMGKLNYTIKSIRNDDQGRTYVHAAIEVQLFNKKFYIKKAQGPMNESPSIAWSRFSSIEAAWDHVKTLTGGWYGVASNE